MLNTLHAFIRFSSICRPFQYKKVVHFGKPENILAFVQSFTASLLIKQTTAIWIISVALSSVLTINATCYYLAMVRTSLYFFNNNRHFLEHIRHSSLPYHHFSLRPHSYLLEIYQGKPSEVTTIEMKIFYFRMNSATPFPPRYSEQQWPHSRCAQVF